MRGGVGVAPCMVPSFARQGLSLPLHLPPSPTHLLPYHPSIHPPALSMLAHVMPCASCRLPCVHRVYPLPRLFGMDGKALPSRTRAMCCNLCYPLPLLSHLGYLPKICAWPLVVHLHLWNQPGTTPTRLTVGIVSLSRIALPPVIDTVRLGAGHALSWPEKGAVPHKISGRQIQAHKGGFWRTLS